MVESPLADFYRLYISSFSLSSIFEDAAVPATPGRGTCRPDDLQEMMVIACRCRLVVERIVCSCPKKVSSRNFRKDF